HELHYPGAPDPELMPDELTGVSEPERQPDIRRTELHGLPLHGHHDDPNREMRRSARSCPECHSEQHSLRPEQRLLDKRRPTGLARDSCPPRPGAAGARRFRPAASPRPAPPPRPLAARPRRPALDGLPG